MKLQPVTGTPFTATCKGCGKPKLFGGSESLPFAQKGAAGFADADGEPFKAYYCGECVQPAGPGEYALKPL